MMNVYLIAVLLAVLLVVFDKQMWQNSTLEHLEKLYIKRNRVASFVAFLVLSLSMGLRGDFLIDTRNYYYIFSKMQARSFAEVFAEPERIFYLLNLFVGKLGGSYQVFLVVCAVIMAYAYVHFMEKESKSISLSFLVLLCSGSFFTGFNVMRIVMAAALFSLCYRYMEKGAFFKYALCVMLVSMVHSSAIILLLCYPFCRVFKWERLSGVGTLATVGCIGIAIYAVSEGLMNMFAELIYAHYLEDGVFGMDYGVSLAGTLKGLALSGIVIVSKKRFNLADMRERVIYNACVLHFFTVLCGAQVFMAQRMTHYFVPAVMLAYPIVVSRLPQKQRVQYGVVLVAFLVASIMNTIIGSEYYFFWDNVWI